MARLVLLALALLALFASAAPAATVRLAEVYVPDDEEYYDREDDSRIYSVLHYVAGRGERNRLTVWRVKGGLLFRDTRDRD